MSSTLQPAGQKGQIIPIAIHMGRLLWGDDQATFYALGRYFPTKNARHDKHQFSKRILESKNREEPFLADALAQVLARLRSVVPTSLVTVVPPKPKRQSGSGLVPTVQRACSIAQLPFRVDALSCVDYPSQREVPFGARMTNVQGKFKARRDLECQHVILIDDIMTTGSTLIECCIQLLNAGIDQVTAFALGLDQNVIPPTHQLTCDVCGANLTVRIRREDGKPFWGCQRYAQGCSNTLDWEIGLQKSNELNTLGPPAISV